MGNLPKAHLQKLRVFLFTSSIYLQYLIWTFQTGIYYQVN